MNQGITRTLLPHHRRIPLPGTLGGGGRTSYASRTTTLRNTLSSSLGNNVSSRTTARSFASGGFQGSNSRGMGRDGGGRGQGGRHRAPRERGGRGGGGRGAAGGEGSGSSFAAFKNRKLSKTQSNLDQDLEAARKQTAAAATGGRGAGVAGFGNTKPPVRIHKQTNHPPHYTPDEQQQGGGKTHHRPSRASHRGGPPKSNFDESTLRPASEGHLSSKHTSAIPKLAARKPKGHSEHDGEQLGMGDVGQRQSGRTAVKGRMHNRVMSDLESEERRRGLERGGDDGASGGLRSVPLSDLMESRGRPSLTKERLSRSEDYRQSPRGQQGMKYLRGSSRPSNIVMPVPDENGMVWDDDYDSDDEEIWGDIMQQGEFDSSMVNEFSKVDNQDDDGYDSDADLEPITTADEVWDESHEYVSKNSSGELVYNWEAMDWDALMQLKAEGYYEEVQEPDGRDRNFRQYEDDDEDPLKQYFEYNYFFRDVTDPKNPFLYKPSVPDSNAVLPLKPHGPELDDFLFAATNHPSKYAKIERKVKHADSKREPRPSFRRDHKLPTKEFVEKYKGYLYVTGLLPHLDEEKEAMDFDDVKHKEDIAEAVAELFENVSPLDVSPASSTSAFIGFATKLEAKKAMIDSASDGRLRVQHPIELQKYEGKEEDDTTEEEKKFVSSSPDGASSILKVTGLPATATSAELLQSMFPPGSRLEAMFGPLTKDDYLRVSSSTALINLASADLVSKALKSKNIPNNANEGVGKRSIQVLRAKRERVFEAWTGVNRAFGQSKLGDRLFVTGDVPPNEMFLSHHDMLHISGLPPSVTLQDLATFFQPFSADRRDVFGSGHIVRCSQGIPTGSAYIGFELPDEIDQVVEMYAGMATIGGCDVSLRPVRDKLLRRGVRETARPSRTVEELRADLYDWERHVDPKDIAELKELGIEKEVLDEVMITLRHHNRTFAAGDQSISGERLYQERQVGTHYRDAVRKYLKMLKSCVGTREEPGLMYEAMFSPDQEVDMGLFDIEEDRIKKLRKKGI